MGNLKSIVAVNDKTFLQEVKKMYGYDVSNYKKVLPTREQEKQKEAYTLNENEYMNVGIEQWEIVRIRYKTNVGSLPKYMSMYEIQETMDSGEIKKVETWDELERAVERVQELLLAEPRKIYKVKKVYHTYIRVEEETEFEVEILKSKNKPKVVDTRNVRVRPVYKYLFRGK